MRPFFLIDMSSPWTQRMAIYCLLFWVIFTLFLYQILLNPHSLAMLRKVRPLSRPQQQSESLDVVEDFDREKPSVSSPGQSGSIGVLMIGCNRADMIRNSLTQLIDFRNRTRTQFIRRYGPTLSDSLRLYLQLPIVVSLDCAHDFTIETVRKMAGVDQILEYPNANVKVPDLNKQQRKLEGYYRIARHYRWALEETFRRNDFQQLIIVEDDLNVSPDFFEYFLALSPLLQQDPTLMCISAWNDNGKQALINSSESTLLHRTDFFPGLGWMLQRSLWENELALEWPLAFWDDWLRHWKQMKNRNCIRPEIPRTSTSGKKGVSKGQFFEQHLKHIRHFDGYVPFFELRPRLFAQLNNDTYRRTFHRMVYQEAEEISAIALKYIGQDGHRRSYRVTYHTRKDFVTFATQFGLMSDVKFGVPRTAYRGVISFQFGGHRVFLAPPSSFKTYIKEWN